MTNSPSPAAAPDHAAAGGLRCFPLLFVRKVAAVAEFYEGLGFTRHAQNPPTGEPHYVGLRRDQAELAVVNGTWPQEQYGVEAGAAPTAAMFVFVDDVDAVLERLRSEGTTVLREPVNMPWGERIAHVTDPEGGAVALASPIPAAHAAG
ncbi:VOC family protein [Actinospica durhamensis]|uniref:VOC family protein n=1 Tax=Actinospica durhamensis TaxID=1508375 RepID=A0A941EQG8_9ACTN|nr:VOC family protein [Actinospica durhamensis]MBR7831889.1 VOC family protein [Actinospica durhamensis]